MSCSRWFSVLGVCFLAAGCAAAGGARPEVQEGVETEPYKIGAEDVLEIAVWQNQDVSRTVTVRPDGHISLPLVDDIQAAGLSPEELKNRVRDKLSPFTATMPEVSVIVLQVNSKRFVVQGEVNNPGVFPLRNPTRVSHAITLAGGFTEFAKKNKIRIVRRWQGQPQTLRVKYKKIMKGGAGEEDILLKPDDIVLVP